MTEPSSSDASTPGVLRRLLDRVTSTTEQAHAAQLQQEAHDRGSTPVVSCCTGEQVTVSGTLRALTLRPVGGVPALEAELYDGSGVLTLIWLGRRRIRGIDPGRGLSAHGRVTMQDRRPVMFNPIYELRP